MRAQHIVVVALALVSAACGGSPTSPNGPETIVFDFNQGPQGWVGSYNCPIFTCSLHPTFVDDRPLPAELDATRSGLYILTGGEDVFSYYKGRATGLRPQTNYQISFDVQIATNEPHGCFGAGHGPPGEGTHVKAGASDFEPVETPTPGGAYRLNINIGPEGENGTNMLVIGNVANSLECQSQNGVILRRWEYKELTSAASTLRAMTATDGSLWFIVGTDQAFFGRIPLYYTRFTAVLGPE